MAVAREASPQSSAGKSSQVTNNQPPPSQRQWPRSQDRGVAIFNTCFELGAPLIYLLDGHARVACGQVHFIDENGGGPGLRLRKRQRAFAGLLRMLEWS